VAAHLPACAPVGRPREVELRDIVDAILYIASTGCQWRQLPMDFAPYSTVQGYFYARRDVGRWQTINHALVMASREKHGREASPTAGLSTANPRKPAKAAVRADSTQVRRSWAVSGTSSHLIGVVIHAADIPDHDSAPLALSSIRSAYPWLRHVFADGGYAGPKLERALAGQGHWTVEIVKRLKEATGFVLMARRGVVERTFALRAHGNKGGRPYTMTPAKLHLAKPRWPNVRPRPATCTRNWASRARRSIASPGPNGELRRDGAKLFKRTAQNVSSERTAKPARTQHATPHVPTNI
jgi:transposase